MRKLSILLGLSTAIFTLNACKTVMDPTFLPSGYTYNHEQYKAPPADKAWNIGYDYTSEKNAAVLETWRMVAADITDKLEADSSLAGTPVFLSSPEIDNAFSLSLDHALRDEFRARGVIVAPVPTEESFKLAVSVYDPEFKDAIRSYDVNDQTDKDLPEPPKEVSKPLVIKIIGLVDDMSAVLLEEPYELPLYGYEDEQLYFPLANSIAGVWR